MVLEAIAIKVAREDAKAAKEQQKEQEREQFKKDHSKLDQYR